jgi:mono/diheme cytochrome c family protein
VGAVRNPIARTPKVNRSMHYHCALRVGSGSWVARIAAVVALAAIGSIHAEERSEATLVARGRYLVAAGDCISCHTRPGGKVFSGGLAMETPFGTVYTPNITPDKETGIGGWTEKQLAYAMRTGIDDEGNHLYPVFPYTSYTKVTDADVHAIYAYLKFIPAVRYRPSENQMRFPFGMRSLLFFWKKLHFTEGRFTPNPARSSEWNRGAYLVEGLGHCGECHTPRNSLGGSRSDLALTGGTYSSEVRDSVDEQTIVPETDIVRSWAAVNLTNAPNGLRAWSVEDLQAYLKTGHSKRAGAFGPMAEVVDNGTRYLTDADTHAVAVYLKEQPERAQPPRDAISASQTKAGEVVYTSRCGDCHLPTGLGMPPGPDADSSKVSPPLRGNAIIQAPDPATLINVILYGVHQTPEGGGTWPRMPGFQNAIGFEDEQIAALCNYLRSAWGNTGGVVLPSDVAKQR